MFKSIVSSITDSGKRPQLPAWMQNEKLLPIRRSLRHCLSSNELRFSRLHRRLPRPLASQPHAGTFSDYGVGRSRTSNDLNLRTGREIIKPVKVSRAAADVQIIKVWPKRQVVHCHIDDIISWAQQIVPKAILKISVIAEQAGSFESRKTNPDGNRRNRSSSAEANARLDWLTMT